MKHIHHFVKKINFVCHFWVKCRQTLLDYGASRGKGLKGSHFRNYAAVEKSNESQLPPIFMYRRHHAFHLCSLFLACVGAVAILEWFWWRRGPRSDFWALLRSLLIVVLISALYLLASSLDGLHAAAGTSNRNNAKLCECILQLH